MWTQNLQSKAAPVKDIRKLPSVMVTSQHDEGGPAATTTPSYNEALRKLSHTIQTLMDPDMEGSGVSNT